jgi:hypothetical protein
VSHGETATENVLDRMLHVFRLERSARPDESLPGKGRSLGRTIFAFFVIWLVAVAAGIWLDHITNPPQPLDPAIPAWHQFAREWLQLTTLKAALLQVPHSLLLWTTLVFFLWFFWVAYKFAEYTPTHKELADHRRRRLWFLPLWLGGGLIIVTLAYPLLSTLLPDASGELVSSLTRPAPTFILWSALVAIAYCFAEATFNDLQSRREDAGPIASFATLWAALIIVLVAIFVVDYTTFLDLQRGIDLGRPERLAARIAADRLAAQADCLATTASTAAAGLTAANQAIVATTQANMPQSVAQLVGCEAGLDRAVADTGPALVTAAAAARAESVTAMTPPAGEANAARIVRERRATAAAHAAGVLEQDQAMISRLAIRQTMIATAIAGLPAYTNVPAATPTTSPADESAYLQWMVANPATEVRSDGATVWSSLVRLADDEAQLPTYLWVSFAYALFVLLPWAILALFLLRRRDNLAGRIVTDLVRLDPAGDLLSLALESRQTRHEDDHRMATEAAQLMVQQRKKSLPASGATQPDRLDKIRALIAERAFGSGPYVVAVGLLTVVVGLGWYLILYAQPGAGPRDLLADPDAGPVIFGFLGGYFYLVYWLLRRYLGGDLYPAAFLQAVGRVVVVAVLGIILGDLAEQAPGLLVGVVVGAAAGTVAAPVAGGITSALKAPNQVPAIIGTGVGAATALAAGVGAGANWGGPDQARAIAAAVAFLAGIFPQEAFQVLVGATNRLLRAGTDKQQAKEQPAFPGAWSTARLIRLAGIDIWTEARLAEEGIEDIIGLANAHLERLVVRTRFTAAQLVDWVDQGLLFRHAGSDGDWFAALRRAGVQTASDLLRVGGLRFGPGWLAALQLDTSTFPWDVNYGNTKNPALEQLSATLQRLAKEAQECSRQDDSSKMSVATGGQTNSTPAAPTSQADGAPKQSIPDADDLRRLCTLLLRAENLQYVLNYRQDALDALEPANTAG